MLTCPLCVPNNPNNGYFHVLQLDCDIYIAFNIATVTLRGQYQNMGGMMTSGTFQIPLIENEMNITSCDLYYNGKHYVTSVIDPTIVDVQKNLSSNSTEEKPYNPSVYCVPFENCPPNASITVDVTFIQQLAFTSEGSYQLRLPLRIPPVNTPQNYQYYSTIKCILDSGTPSCQYQCLSHPMTLMQQNTPYSYPNNPYVLSGTAAVALQSPPIPLQQTTEFVFNYLGYGSIGLSGTCLIEEPSNQTSNFVLHLSPTTPHPNTISGRNMVFLLDHSGSMNGITMIQAKAAIQQAIKMLTPADYFTICAFDHEMIWFQCEGGSNPYLVRADPEATYYACQWIEQIDAHGLTDILTPYQIATDLLNHPRTSQYLAQSAARGPYKIAPNTSESSISYNLPIIFLVTDGAVANEHDICQYAQIQCDSKNLQANGVRTFSFGIGPFVNPYFLKYLSTIGRGYAEICLHQDLVCSKIVELMRRTYSPQLTDIILELPNTIRDVEIYPLPIPDLYAGYPVTVAGQYTGKFPTTIYVKGKDFSGNLIRVPVTVRFPYRPISIKKLFASFYLDFLVSKYWINKDENGQEAKRYRKNAAEVSCQTGVPCVFTQSVAYETTPCPPPSEMPSNETTQNQKQKKPGMSTSDVIVGGTLVGLGATAAGLLMFGNVSATINNIGTDQAFQLLSNLQLSTSTLHAISSGISHFANHLAHGVSPVINNLSRVGGEAVGQIGHVAAPVVNQIGHVGSQAVGHIGHVAVPVVNQIGNVGNDACGCLCGMCQDVCKFDTLQSIGYFICHILRLFG